MDIELRVVVLKHRHATATITGTGESIFSLKFVAAGDKTAVEYLAALLADDRHSGYTPYTGPWGGKIGASLPKLLNILTLLVLPSISLLQIHNPVLQVPRFVLVGVS